MIRHTSHSHIRFNAVQFSWKLRIIKEKKNMKILVKMAYLCQQREPEQELTQNKTHTTCESKNRNRITEKWK